MKTIVLTACFSLIMALGCGADDKADNGQDPNQPTGPETPAPETPAPETPAPETPAPAVAPTASFQGLTAYDGFQGTIDIELEHSASVDKVELLADGKVVATADAAPFKITWDSTKVADGVVKLQLVSHAGDETAKSDELPVILFNEGEAATWIDGSRGEMSIAEGLDSHVKHHWIMPQGVTRVIGVVTWDNPEFKLDLAVGVGGCPHSGEEAARANSDTSPAMVEFVAQGNLTEAQWFAHSGATNEPDLLNKKSGYQMKVYLLK